MTVIFDELRIKSFEEITKEAGKNASIDKYRWASHEFGNKAYFDADSRLNKLKRQEYFEPLEKDEISYIFRDADTIELAFAIPKFAAEFSQLQENFTKQHDGKFIIDLMHNTAHLGIGHTPREEGLTYIVENIFYGTDVVHQLMWGTFLSSPPLKEYYDKGQICGLKFDALDIEDIVFKLGRAMDLCIENDFFNTYDVSFGQPIVLDTGNPNITQLTVSEVYEAVAAGKLVESRIYESIGTPLSQIKLLDLSHIPSKLFTLSEKDRDVVHSLVYPDKSSSDKNLYVKNNYSHVAKYLDEFKFDVETSFMLF